jgi:Phosphomannose isomerase type I
MALSDNVVRAGLTPKFKDVKTLCDMLHYGCVFIISVAYCLLLSTVMLLLNYRDLSDADESSTIFVNGLEYLAHLWSVAHLSHANNIQSHYNC